MILTALSVSSLFTFAFLPLLVLLVLAVAMIPTLLAPGAKIGAAAKALYCYVIQCIGVAMMSAGALPAVYGVIEKFSLGIERFSAEVYLALLILFSCGGITYLWHERLADKIDDTSRRVPALLFWYTFKVIGYVLMLGSLLSILSTMLLIRPLDGGWWILSVVLFFYGALLSWCTHFPSGKGSSFQMMPMTNGLKLAKKRK
jgi:hypothetical protein